MAINDEQYKLIFTNDAIKEMDNIFYYISENLYATSSAQKLMSEIDDAIENLKYMPKAYSVIKEHLQMEYRRVIVKKYVIIYTIDEEEKKVNIMHIYYGGRDYFNKM